MDTTMHHGTASAKRPIATDGKVGGQQTPNLSERSHSNLKTFSIFKMRINEQKWSNTHRWVITTEEASIQLEIYPEPCGEEKIKAYIWALWVNPEARKGGIATELLHRAEAIAKAEGESSVWLEWDDADSDRFVLDWYLRNGYDEVAFGTHNVLLRKVLT